MNVHQPALPVLLVLLPLFAAFLIPMVGWYRRRLARPLALAALVGNAVVAALVVQRVVLGGPLSYYMGGWEPPWGIELRIDGLSALVVGLLSAVGLLVGVYAQRSILDERPDKVVPFWSVYLLLLAGLTGMVITGDLFNLYVFLEISSLSGYALIAIGGPRAPFATFRYLIYGTAGACFYLLGVASLYAVTGTLNMADLSAMLPALYGSRAVLMAVAFMVVGVGIKLGLFPLHGWLPDAYTHAPSAVSALIAPTMTKVAAYVLVRVGFFVFTPRFFLDELAMGTVLAWLAAAGILYGSAMALAQTELKRMLAFSSVSQVGYIVLGLSLGNAQGFTGGVLHIVNHGFMKATLFAAVGAFALRAGARRLEDLAFLSKRMPWTSLAFALGALSMIGIPPTAGFFSKWYLALGAVQAESWGLVAVILISSLLNAAYFFRVIEHAFLKPQRALRSGEDPHTVALREAPLSMLAPTLALAVSLLVLGLASHWIVGALIVPALPTGLS